MTRLGSVARKAVLANVLPADLLDPEIPLERARTLFADYVDEVEIENHGFCNRLCSFCPNTFLDRRSRIDRMPDAVFDRILADLASIGYAGALTWSRFHEAMADESIHERVARARRAVPRAQLVMISNGDYMAAETLPRLERDGLDRLMIDLYLPDGRERDRGAVEARLDAFTRRTGLALEPGGEWAWRVRDTPLKVTVEVPCYAAADLSTRGGLLDLPKRSTYRRRAVCVAPVRHVVVDWNGKGMLCCQTRSDAPEHAGAVIGDLSRPGYGLFHLYRDAGAARRALLSPGEKGGVCLTCDVRDDGPDRLARRETVAVAFSGLPGAERVARRLWQRTMRRRYVAPRGVAAGGADS